MDDSIYRQALAGYRLFPPWLELVLGGVALACGLFLSRDLWEMGYVSQHVLFLGLFGVVIVANGLRRTVQRSRLVAQLNVLRLRESEILSKLSEMPRGNPSGRTMLRNIGITDERLCRYLLNFAEISRKKH